MFPEDVHLNIISFLGPAPRKRCWCSKPNGQRCTKPVSNTSQCIFCPIHEKQRFDKPLFKPYEDLLYIVKKIGKFPKPKKKKTPPHFPYPALAFGYPNFPYV